MYSRFYLALMLISGIALVVIVGFIFYREFNPEWMYYQRQYKKLLIQMATDEKSKKKAASLELGHRQIYIPALKRVDRCMNCHIGVDNPLMAKADVPYKSHSGDYLKKHPLAKFGCTVCHMGQGRATTKKDAHGEGRETHWDYPVLPFKYIESSCAQCHDFKFLAEHGYTKVAKGRELFIEKGCRGCHKLNGIGGDLGKALDGVASQPIAYFPMANVVGEKNTYNWHYQHFLKPQKIVKGSKMRVFLKPEEAELLTVYVLTLRKEEMPKQYRRIRYFPELPKDGRSLYQMFCIACHGNGKVSVYDEILQRTIPAIQNPAFLRLADDKTLTTIIKEGRKGTPMTAWKKTGGGLTDAQIQEIIKFITRDRPSEMAPPFNYRRFVTDVQRGKKLFDIRCSICHGKDGKGGKNLLGINLVNPTVQKLVDPEFLAKTIRDGRKGTPMPPFGPNGIGLSNQDIADIVAYVRTLGKKK